MALPDACVQTVALRQRLTLVRKLKEDPTFGVNLLVPRDWLRAALSARERELEGLIAIREKEKR